MTPLKPLTKKEKSRLKIMHAAKGLFEEQGIDQVTFTHIAEEAEVCRTTVFNHFAGTSELLLGIFTQEIEDLIDHCEETCLTGEPLIYALFDRLIEDTANYPSLSVRLLNNAVMIKDGDNPIRLIEKITADNLPEGSQQTAVLICGAYYGLINHYYINNKKFDPAVLKNDFHGMLEVISGGKND